MCVSIDSVSSSHETPSEVPEPAAAAAASPPAPPASANMAFLLARLGLLAKTGWYTREKGGVRYDLYG